MMKVRSWWRALPRSRVRFLSDSPVHGSGETNLKPLSKMPGIKGWPLVGAIPMLLKDAKAGKAGKENVMWKLHSKLGPIFKMKMLGNTWSVATSSPEAIESAFRSEGKYPSRGVFESNMMWIFRKLDSPPPMFFSNGEIWKSHRLNASKQVIPRRVANFVFPLCVIAEKLLSHFENIQDEAGNVQDISPELHKWAFQGISYFVYGEKINVYSGIDPVHKEFMEAGVDYIRSIECIVFALPIYKLYPNKTFRDYKKIVRRMQRAGKQVVDRSYSEMKETIASGIVDEGKAIGLLQQWLIEGKFTEEEALSQSYDMLSAGIDTTMNSATFLLYEIAKNPEIQERLVEEISSVQGDKEHPSWDDLQKMTLVRNCVKETMRLYNPTEGSGRVLKDDAVLLGYHVPAGTAIMLSTGVLTRDETLFPQPEEFKPDRWNRDNAEKLHPFASLPFGFGPRSCYGRRLAELELYILLAKTLPKYRLTTNVNNMKIKRVVVTSPAVPVHVNFNRRV